MELMLDELKERGYKEELIRIGRIFYNDDFFIVLQENGAHIVYLNYNEMPIGVASNIEELVKCEYEGFKILYNVLGRRCRQLNKIRKSYKEKIKEYEVINK